MTDPLLSSLLSGRATATSPLGVHLSERDGVKLHDKLRQAYWWIINNAVITPTYDLEYGVASELKTPAGEVLALHGEMSYSSYVLMPLLTLVTCRRALLVGGPGRGKTTSAVLMALLSGASRDEVRRGILRGHPQLSMSDLLGAPLPSDLRKAESVSEVKVSWRSWITSRVKIIDEYNRIPTKTQSALLSLMAEGQAEMFDQVVLTGRSSWFLTANDDAGGGTFQVIEALKDRIDVVVRAVPFNSAFTAALLARIEADRSPEDLVPEDIVFSHAELDAAYTQALAVAVPPDVLDRLAYFLGQLDYCRMASPRFEHKSKDTLKLAGKTVASVCNEQCPLDKRVHLCAQTENGVSARVFQTALHYAKALAWFRGLQAVTLEDIGQVLPWVLHDKLQPNPRGLFFQDASGTLLLRDRAAWISHMFGMAMTSYERHSPLRRRVVAERTELDRGLAGLARTEVEKRLARIAQHLAELVQRVELSAAVYEDIIHLKSIYSRYQNYLAWLKESGR